MLETFNRPIGADDTYRILEVATDVEFNIRNEHPFGICIIEIRTPGGSWQDIYDHFSDGGGEINPGEVRTFTLRAGYYDMRLTDCAGTWLDDIDYLYVRPAMATKLLS
jgi:hypothetical protein